MTPALGWTAMGVILMSLTVRDKSLKIVSTNKKQKTKKQKKQKIFRERRTEAESSRGPSAYQPITPYR